MHQSGIHLGKLVEKAWNRSGMTSSEFALAIGQARQNVRQVFSRQSMDTELLFRISTVLGENFFQVLAEALKIAPRENPESGKQEHGQDMRQKVLELELEAAKKEIEYLKEIVTLLKQR